MKISTLFYTIRQGFANIFRNKWYSLASIATISACLFLFGLFYAIVVNFQSIVMKAYGDADSHGAADRGDRADDSPAGGSV